ncbi:MAG: hypothetical protein JSV84_10130 [Gemmatimonadota bacterium]|nr:MAG: hypothetical protein JSV84_10130 [Gemmatimonadota bacterium]
MKVIAVLSVEYSLAFFLLEKSKLFRPAAAEEGMAKLPYGRFDWGYVWPDQLVLGPLFLIGGMVTVIRSNSRLGRLFAVTGFAMNLYATIFLYPGFLAVVYRSGTGESLFLLLPGLIGLWP